MERFLPLQLRALVSIATVVLTGAVGYAVTYLPGVPRWWGPMPMPTAYFALVWYGEPEQRLLSVLPVMGVAALLGLPLLFGLRRVRLETGVPVLLAILASGAWYILGCIHGVFHRNLGFVVACSIVTLCADGALVTLWWSTLRSPSQIRTALFHAIASLWLASYAFPLWAEVRN